MIVSSTMVLTVENAFIAATAAVLDPPRPALTGEVDLITISTP